MMPSLCQQYLIPYMQSNRQYIPEGMALTLSLGEGLRQSAVKSATKGPKRGQCERREGLHRALQEGVRGSNGARRRLVGCEVL